MEHAPFDSNRLITRMPLFKTLQRVIIRSARNELKGDQESTGADWRSWDFYKVNELRLKNVMMNTNTTMFAGNL